MTEPRGAWLRPRPTAPKQPQSQQQQQQPSRSTTASPSQSKPASPAPAPAGNVWATRAAQRATPAAKNEKSTAASTQEKQGSGKKEKNPAVAPAQAAAKHEAVNGFNEGEIKEALGRGVKGEVYKVGDKSAGAEGAIMANGQNFFVELSKQVAALQIKK